MKELDRAAIIEEVQSRVDIVQLVSEYVELKRSGVSFLGLCPFHREKTPSFNVSREKRRFYCFGCHEAGDVFSFLMKIEGISFSEALERLAERAGVNLDSAQLQGNDEAAKLKKAFFDVNKLTAKFYHTALLKHPSAEDARKYLIRRGITSADVTDFRLGYALNTWSSLSDFLTSKGYERNFLVSAGLVSVNSARDGIFDKMRNRVIFPIFDERRRVVGFGGRAIDDTSPKYLNSPETAVFDKSRLLYGLCQARDMIRTDSKAVLVEGYMDVIACHRAGVRNAVASLGTSFTKEQAKLLSRFAKEIVICYDSDNAGIAATLKAYDVLSGMGYKVRVASLGSAKDPGELVQESGVNTLFKAVEDAVSIIDYRLEHVLNKVDVTTVDGRIEAVALMVPILASLTNAVERVEYLRLTASRLDVSVDALEEEIKKVRRLEPVRSRTMDTLGSERNTNRKTVAQTVSVGSNNNLPGSLVTAERELLSLILTDHDKLTVIKNSFGSDSFKVPIHRTVAEALFSIESNTDGPPDFNIVCNEIADEEGKNFLTRLALEPKPNIDKERLFLDCANKIREYQLRDKIGSLKEQAESYFKAGHIDKANECLRELQACRERLEHEFLNPRN